jgi:hypothetical protein
LPNEKITCFIPETKDTKVVRIPSNLDHKAADGELAKAGDNGMPAYM